MNASLHLPHRPVKLSRLASNGREQAIAVTSINSNEHSAGIFTRLRILPLYWIPGAVLMVAMLALVHLYGVNVPFHDDFEVPGHFLFRFAIGDFQWRYLWELSNDSRLVIPKLIWLAEACTVGWAPKHWMYGAVLLAFAEICLAIGLLRKSGADNFICWSFSVFAALLLLHTGNARGTFFQGSQAVVMFPGFFLLLGSYLYSRSIPFKKKLAIYAILALLSTFSFANGMLLWLFLFPVFPFWHEIQTGSNRRRSNAILSSALVCVLGLLVVLLYFKGFRWHSSPSWNGWSSFASYYCTWLGASLASRVSVDYSFVFGVLMLTLAFVISVLVLVSAAYRRSTERLEAAWPWLLLLGYVGSSGIADTFGRQSMGTTNAVAPRYFLITLFFPLGLGGLLSSVVGASVRSTRNSTKIYSILSAAVLLAASTFSLMTWGSGWQKSFAHFQGMKRRELALSLWRQAPDIYPLPARKQSRFRTHYFTLVDAGFLRDLGRDEWLLGALRNAALRPPVGEFSIKAQEPAVANGWAMHPTSRLPFPAVVAAIEEADGTLRVINVALMTRTGPLQVSRSDVRDHSHFMMGFALSPLGGYHSDFRDFDRVRVFAIDPALKEAYPLQHRQR
jgi:hypothetical protein